MKTSAEVQASGTFEERMAIGYQADEVKRLDKAMAYCDEDIEKLQAQIKDIRKKKRAYAKDRKVKVDQIEYDAYVHCLVCFPYRDFEAAARAEHTCGLTAAQRSSVFEANFKD